MAATCAETLATRRSKSSPPENARSSAYRVYCAPALSASPVRLEVQVINVHVYLDHFEAGHTLDPFDHVLPNGVRRLDDALPVVGDDIDIHCGLAFAEIH